MSDERVERDHPRHLFVYGTLRPGDVRWGFLEPYVTDRGAADSVTGALYDTGLGFPAAIFDEPGTIVGRTYELRWATIDAALEELDEVEGTVAGFYHRVRLNTAGGTRAWAYQYGRGLELTPIASGNWFDR